MRIDRTLWLTAAVAIGAALVTFPFLPGNWPNPLPEGPRLAETDLLQLKMAAARVDLACDRGDLGSFDAAVTPEHLQRLQRQLQAVEKPLDADTLKQFRTLRTHSFADLMRMPILASEVRGERAAVAVGLPEEDGAQVLEFVWDGRKMRLDGSRRAVEAATQKSARALVVDAVARRQR